MVNSKKGVEKVQQISFLTRDEKSIKTHKNKRNEATKTEMKEKFIQHELTFKNKKEGKAYLNNPKNNFALVVKQEINKLNQQEMDENFKKAVKFHGTKKVTIRIDRDVLDFYENLSLDCTTAMKKALRVVMEAVKARQIKL